MNDSHPEVRILLKWVTHHFTTQVTETTETGVVTQSPRRPLKWSSDSFSTALFGLRGMGMKTGNRWDGKNRKRQGSVKAPLLSDELLNLLVQLNVSFLKSNGPFEIKHIGPIMHSLSKMSSDYEPVRNIVSTLTSKVSNQRLLHGEKHRQPIPDLAFAKALYGLRSMTSDSSEVLAMVALLTDLLVVEGRGYMNLQAISMAMYGIANLSSVHTEVQALLEVLNQRYLAASEREPLSSYSIATIFSSLHIFKANGFMISVDAGANIIEKELSIRREVLQTIVHSLEASKSQHLHLNGIAVSAALRGLSHLSPDIPEVSRLLELLLQKAMRINHRSIHGSTLKGSTFPLLQFTPDQATGALTAFHNMNSDRVVVKDWLLFLSETLTEGMQTSPPSVSYVISGYKGLRKMNSQCEAVRKILKALYLTVNGTQHRWTSLDISLVLNSLQNMNCFHYEVRNTLQAVCHKSKGDSFSPDLLSLSLYGMRNMTPNYVAVSDTLVMLAKGIGDHQHSKDSTRRNAYSARAVTTCLYGLQNMSSSHKEVKDLLISLESAIVHCPDVFRNQEIGSAYFGLQSMDIVESNLVNEEVVGVLRAVNNKLETAKESLNARAVSDILFGLQRSGI